MRLSCAQVGRCTPDDIGKCFDWTLSGCDLSTAQAEFCTPIKKFLNRKSVVCQNGDGAVDHKSVGM